MTAADEADALARRLRDSGMPCQLAEAGALREQQLFVAPTPGVVVEFVGAAGAVV